MTLNIIIISQQLILIAFYDICLTNSTIFIASHQVIVSIDCIIASCNGRLIS